ncbi:HNH endonuclease [Acidobacteria bacterium AH-259-O06]|nr:HNH endonuclease [Acidobacteria bacterium AH-259-O06]
MIFVYPTKAHKRRHGPDGYRDYQSYKDWLRDEFTFRCVYCLFRELWYPDRHRAFGVDHFVPKSVDETLALNYDNLLYSCPWCNSNKSAEIGPLLDPCVEPYGEHLEVGEDGCLKANSADGEILIDVLLLNEADKKAFRKRMLSQLELLEKLGDKEKLKEYFGFPLNLPDLRRKRPRENRRSEGVARCYYVLRERGELPETY